MTTALDTYMKEQKVGDADMAVLIARDRSVVSKIRRGLMRPTLDVAARIETVTHGAVPMQAWSTTDAQAAA